MPASDYLKTKLLNLAYGGVAFAPPSRFLALITADGTEVPTSGTSYVRQSLPSFTLSGSNPTVANLSLAVSYPVATAAWGSITGWAIYDASSGGNPLNTALFDTARDVKAGDAFTLAPGGIKISLL